jgi:FixJ family two-component response regulator
VQRILLVDDESRVLAALARNLSRAYRVETSSSPAAALELIPNREYAVVVSDLKMPGMSGIEFLSKVRDLCPEVVRILLTGHADLDVALAAVNEGNIFRFLTKPCDQIKLKKALDAALEQYRLVLAERDVLRETLIGTVNLLVEVLSAIQPVAFGRTSRIRLYVQHLARELNVGNLWEIEAAASLSQLGCISVPESTIRKYCFGEALSESERSQIQSHPSTGARFLQSIPRMHTVAEIIEHYLQADDEVLETQPSSYVVAVGTQLLRVAHDFDRYIRHGMSWRQAVGTMRLNPARYDPALLAVLENMGSDSPGSYPDSSVDPFCSSTSTESDEQKFEHIAERLLALLQS